MPTSIAPKPLAGFTIGVTADRRSAEQMSLLEGRGATCVHGPTVRTHPLRPEAEIGDATRKVIDHTPDFVLLTTGIGVRGWLEAADAVLIGEQLREALGGARLLARGPKAHGAAITAGLDVEWNAPTATSSELISKLCELAPQGARVCVQVDGDPDRSMVPALQELGFDVIPVPVYRWSLPENCGPAEALVRSVAEQRVDMVTFTARPAAENFTKIAESLGLDNAVRAAFAETVKVVCIGSICAEGVNRLCEAPIVPPRFRLGAMVMTITDVLGSGRRKTSIGGCEVELQGRLVQVDGGVPEMLSDRERQVLDVLIAREGVVVSKAKLLRQVWGERGSDTHVVEVTVGRLRKRLGPAGAGIETVVRRGYRASEQ